MDSEGLLEYLENIIKPALEKYAEERNMSVEQLLLEFINLENTGLFNYKGKQSTVYNRLKNNNISTLKELFDLYDSNLIDYGKNELKYNYYIHNEIDGIVALLKFRFLGIKSDNLKKLLDYKIHMNFNINIDDVHVKYGYPGDVCYSVYGNKFILENIFNRIDEFYCVLKSCGFDQIGVKALIDIAYYQKIDDVSLGEFLSNLSLDMLKDRFLKVPQELKIFLNILSIIDDFYKSYDKDVIHKKC